MIAADAELHLIHDPVKVHSHVNVHSNASNDTIDTDTIGPHKAQYL